MFTLQEAFLCLAVLDLEALLLCSPSEEQGAFLCLAVLDLKLSYCVHLVKNKEPSCVWLSWIVQLSSLRPYFRTFDSCSDLVDELRAVAIVVILHMTV